MRSDGKKESFVLILVKASKIKHPHEILYSTTCKAITVLTAVDPTVLF